MIYRQTYEIDYKNQVLITLPKYFGKQKKIIVTLENVDNRKTKKMKLMQHAKKDSVFLSDISEIVSDFENCDNDSL